MLLGLRERNPGRQALSVHKLVLVATNTAGIITVLVIVGESTPLRSSVDDAGTNDDTAALADHVARGILLHQVGWNLSAVRAT